METTAFVESLKNGSKANQVINEQLQQEALLEKLSVTLLEHIESIKRTCSMLERLKVEELKEFFSSMRVHMDEVKETLIKHSTDFQIVELCSEAIRNAGMCLSRMTMILADRL